METPVKETIRSRVFRLRELSPRSICPKNTSEISIYSENFSLLKSIFSLTERIRSPISIFFEFDQSKTWYGLYSLAKTYTNNKNSVTSQMIWGSQYDAMLNFALTGNDKSKVTSTEYGNDSRTILRSGLTRTSDKINNIYDLGGNLTEWTSEAYRTDFDGRAIRGGYCGISESATYRDCGNPTDRKSLFSLRSSLYVK